ncbi:hypothetical protein LTR09_009920 [Extremus antarcticus]|uniref:Uncharacterized protein n=1 Tax=Extremus antarcticus TaxID=702011 RepID=A0AAJ0D8C9_9PEZI|nr:hypothetical protein LTR09_009920 [Extremus antarcticus]
MRLSLLSALSFLVLSASSTSTHQPKAPALEFLYTSLVECANGLYTTNGPRRLRTTIPIIGGNVTGPRIECADTRYNLQIDDGANIFLQTSGPSQKNGDLHLRVVFETGDKKYYWLNNVVAIGRLRQVEQYEESFVLRIDMWHMATDWSSTTFVNGSTYD